MVDIGKLDLSLDFNQALLDEVSQSLLAHPCAACEGFDRMIDKRLFDFFRDDNAMTAVVADNGFVNLELDLIGLKSALLADCAGKCDVLHELPSGVNVECGNSTVAPLGDSTNSGQG